MRTVLFALLLSGPAWADVVLWSNVSTFPADLQNTADGWSAIRQTDPNLISNRIAADDFELTARCRITRITFYGAEFGLPQIYGGDWYIFRGPPEGPPDTLVAFDANAPMLHQTIGVTNAQFGPIYENVMQPADLVLPPGRYFLAFRTYQARVVPGKNNNGAVTTRWANGASRAWWSFDVLEDGGVAGPWTLMATFNLVTDQEWAFKIEGVVLPPDCPGDTDGDGDVDQDDIDTVLFNYGSTVPPGTQGDLDGDGDVDQDDIDTVLFHYGSSCP